MCVCVRTRARACDTYKSTMPEEATRGAEVIGGCEQSNMDAGNWTRVLCKSGTHA